jgi:hypothetical protein
MTKNYFLQQFYNSRFLLLDSLSVLYKDLTKENLELKRVSSGPKKRDGGANPDILFLIIVLYLLSEPLYFTANSLLNLLSHFISDSLWSEIIIFIF